MNSGKATCLSLATLEILNKHRFRFSNMLINVKLTTLIEAALLYSIAKRVVGAFLSITLIRIRYGIGEEKFKGFVNVLRVVEERVFKAAGNKVLVLETSVNDISGETISYVITKLFKEGAIDVFII
ncbi:MAG: nickel insertion protein [Candidatus Methanomethylicia archaeon]